MSAVSRSRRCAIRSASFGLAFLASFPAQVQSTNGLIRRDWSRNTVRIGDVIIVSGYRARGGGSTRGSVRSITLADGRDMTGNSSRVD